MINWLIAFFYFANSFGILNITQMVTSNLILLLICRGLYIANYTYKFYGEEAKKIDESQKLFLSKRKILFGLRQTIIILFGMLYLPIAVLFSFYALMMSGVYIKNISGFKRIKTLKIIGNLLIFLAPFIGILWFSFIVTDNYSLAILGIGIIAFFRFNRASFSLSELVEKIRDKSINRIHQKIKYAFLILLIVIPTTLIINTALYSPQKKQTIMVEMTDGVKLATDVYFAPGSFGTPRPVILVRTTYGKNEMAGMYGILYSTQNYHLVVQDCRGTFDSYTNDNFLLYVNDYQDGVDTIDWILEQPWCNGKIASTGLSALGINEYFYAGMNPDGLLAQSITVATPDLYKTSIFQGGTFRESITTGWLKLTCPTNYEYQLEQLVLHPMKDNFYNTTSLFMDIGPSFQNVNCAAIHIGGWYDTFQQGTLDGFMGYDDLGLSGAQGKQLLIMGPFTHGFPSEGEQGELIFPTKKLSVFNLYMEWERKLFDYALLGKHFDWTGDRVAYYMMGDVDNESIDANDYRFATDWPIPYENNTWYLNDGGLLLNNTIGTNVNSTFLYDPRNPVPTLGGTNLLISSGPYDQNLVENRDDVLIFTSPTLTDPYEIVGRMWAHLFVKSNCSNTDFTVKITDVYPDGRSMLISDGIINAVRRDGFNNTAADLNSVEYTELDIDLWSTAYQFNTGHKIRIAISSSNYPRFAINPNSGAPQEVYSYQYLEKFIANNTILMGSGFGSHIILPRAI